jgi:hypothetical protein
MTTEFDSNTNDNDDDDMADLFSFDSSDVPLASPHDIAETGIGAADTATDTERPRKASSDSFLALLESATEGTTNATTAGALGRLNGDLGDHDVETQNILDWLDEDDVNAVPDDDNNTLNINQNTSSASGSDPTAASILAGLPTTETPTSIDASLSKTPSNESSLTVTPVKTAEPTVVALPPVFATLREALESPQATVGQLRHLYATAHPVVDADLRADLYCRMVCGKSLAETQSSSLADSFQHWPLPEPGASNAPDTILQALPELPTLALRVATETHREVLDCQDDLTKLLAYHWQQNSTAAPSEADLLVPAVAAVILSTNMPVAAASVVLAQLLPAFTPVLALEPPERWEAALSLHSELYLLVCYHLPLLVYHLDQYAPGWHWPKLPASVRQKQDAGETSTHLARNLTRHGRIPPSWTLSLAAGECEHVASILPTGWILQLWDGILMDASQQHQATPFFWTVAVFEQAADQLLLLTGEELLAALDKIFQLEDKRSTDDWMDEWRMRVHSLQRSTPESVLQTLRRAEDETVQASIRRRQERAEAAIKARMEAEAIAHLETQERKAEEARARLTRARLVAYYRKHAPDKEDNIDQILKVYAGRLDVLDGKLLNKYGESFNPALKPKQPKPVNKIAANLLMQTMNQGLGRRPQVALEDVSGVAAGRHADKVSVLVTADEVLSDLCWSKEAAVHRGELRRNRTEGRKHLKFYLVDSRAEEAALEQGRFPTAVSLSPEAMLDPERIQLNEETFESLRGAVHIVIMGEGFSAIPKLYGQKLSPKLEELMQQDESRTDICALFFVKKGFPFVSVLDGGFAAAHSWLVREGPSCHLKAAAVLVDYNSEMSLFGQMETLHNASAAEKAQRKMQNLLEKSLVSMTRRAQQFEKLANERDSREGRKNVGLQFFKSKQVAENTNEATNELQPADSQSIADEKKLAFKNPFKGVGRALDWTRSPDDSAPAPEAPAPIDNGAFEAAEQTTSAFKNPFAGVGMGHAPSTSDNTAETTGASGTNGKTAARKSNETANTTATDDSSSKASVPLIKRNPFARFGNKESNPAGASTDRKGGFDFTNFRKNATARLLSRDEFDAASVEESISFD